MTLDARHRSCLDESVYREFSPDRRLRPFVECGWLRSGLATPSIRVMPDGCMDVFVTADGDVMIAGPANTFYDMPAGDQETAVKERLPGAVFTILPGFGHVPMLDDPELVARTILAVTSAAVK